MYLYCAFRDNANRLTAAGGHKYEEKKVQQEKKYKLLNISFRKPVAKGTLCRLHQDTDNMSIYSYHLFIFPLCFKFKDTRNCITSY